MTDHNVVLIDPMGMAWAKPHCRMSDDFDYGDNRCVVAIDFGWTAGVPIEEAKKYADGVPQGFATLHLTEEGAAIVRDFLNEHFPAEGAET